MTHRRPFLPRRFALAAGLAVLLAAATAGRVDAATTTHKCIVAGRTVYQQQACSVGTDPTDAASVAAPAASAAAPAASMAPQARRTAATARKASAASAPAPAR